MDFVRSLAASMEPGSEIAVRSFVEEVPLRRHQAELPLRVSRLVSAWTNTPAARLEFGVSDNLPEGQNNLCSAIALSMNRDFFIRDDRMASRILLITDGKSHFSGKGIPNFVDCEQRGTGTAIIDVVALGSGDSSGKTDLEPVIQTCGTSLKIDKPEEVRQTVIQYSKVLARKTPAPLVVSGSDKKYTVLAGAKLSLPAGSYTVVLPDLPGLDATHSRIPNVTVKSGSTRVVDVKISDGRPIVKE
jgi:hypothetical protein